MKSWRIQELNLVTPTWIRQRKVVLTRIWLNLRSWFVRLWGPPRVYMLRKLKGNQVIMNVHYVNRDWWMVIFCLVGDITIAAQVL